MRPQRPRKQLRIWPHRCVAPLALIAGLLSGVPGAICAEPASWPLLCSRLSDLAGVLTDRRDRGEALDSAVSAEMPQLRIIQDRAVAVEIAQQVYATPSLDRNQEAEAIYAKCVTPLQAGIAPKPAVPKTLASKPVEPRAPAPTPQPVLAQPLLAPPVLSLGTSAALTDLEPIPLRPGPNRISRLAPDGRDGSVSLLWRDEGGGRGQDVFVVRLFSRDDAGWRDVRLPDTEAPASGVIADEPLHGDDMLRSVRFARGNLDGQPATLLLIVTRDEGQDRSATDATYDIYRLAQNNGRDIFQRIVHRRLPDRTCNADMALSIASGLPLRSSYRGPRNASGAFTRDGCRPTIARQPDAQTAGVQPRIVPE